jgi:hypothetical protein
MGEVAAIRSRPLWVKGRGKGNAMQLRRTRKCIAVLVAALALSTMGTTRDNAVQAAGALQAGVAKIQTDKFDYRPGESVQIVGSGFAPGEVVTLEVKHVSGANSGAGHEPFLTSANGAGQIADDWFVDPDDSARAIFTLRAVGQTSGREARTAFTDDAITVLDDNGADDYPGQKDLNFFTFDYGTPGSPSISIAWGWDDTAWSGGNTGDACTLFDTNQDGKANYSFCVSVGGTPAAFLAPVRLYQCSDARSDRCTQSTPVTTFTSSATAMIVANSDPFKALSSHGSGNKCGAKPGCVTDDTVAIANIVLADVGASAAKLINVCSYPSQVPNSDPSECVIQPNNGFLTIKKHAPVGTSTPFTYNLGTNQTFEGGATSKQVTTTNGEGQVQFISMRPRTAGDANAYDLNEAIPATWKLTAVSCAVQTSPTTATGSASASLPVTGSASASAGILNFEIVSGLETVCEFTNAKVDPTLKLTKTVVQAYNSDPAVFNVAAFTLKAAATVFTSGVAKSIAPGTYALSEEASAAVGGTFSTLGWSCSGNATALNNGSLTIAAGETVDCNITNTALPGKLIVQKVVTNNSGGTKIATNFSFQVNGGNAIAFLQDGADASRGKNEITVDRGTYGVTETAPSDYTASYNNCSNVAVNNGATATCTITNDDNQATLIVKKVVVNDSGGTTPATGFSFTLNAVSTAFLNDPAFADGLHGKNSVPLNAGTYTVTEPTIPAGYGQTPLFDGCANVTLAAGETKTCTITNNDAQASPAASSDQSAVLHDSLEITGIRLGAPDAAAARITFSLHTAAGCSAAPVATAESRTISMVGTTGTAATLAGVSVNPSPSGGFATATYWWKTVYSGDAFNQGRTDCVETTQVTFTPK